MNVKIEINTKEELNVSKLESALKDVSKDELKEIAKTLQDINDIVQKVIDTPTFKKGDYVRSKSDPSIYGIIERISLINKNHYVTVKCWNWSYYTLVFTDLEIYTPKKGELCIFWDTHFNSYATINIFKWGTFYKNMDFIGRPWDNCVPFISEEQFKEIIGYDSQS